MVNCFTAPLDRVFSALSDPTRRALLERLAGGRDLSVSALAAPLPMSLPAVLKHLDVLEDAGLIARSKTGRTVACRLTPAPMEDAVAWLERYRRFWSESLDRLAAVVEDPRWPPSRRASLSSAASARRRRGSGRPGLSPS